MLKRLGNKDLAKEMLWNVYNIIKWLGEGRQNSVEFLHPQICCLRLLLLF